MTRARISLEPGYILNARPYSDTSLLLEVFTRDHGRIGMVARGARAPKSRLRALLQPLQPLLLSWSESGELGTLTKAEGCGEAVVLAGERMFMAWYLNELLLRLLQRNDAHPGLFDFYAQALPQLAGAAAEAALRVFEMRLLGEIGYGIDLPDDVDATSYYTFDEQGGALRTQDPNALAGASLIALREENLVAPRDLADARKLLRRALKRQLGERELETPRLLRQMRARKGS
jgi:DNA repair protein RecO (recombination protein O)